LTKIREAKAAREEMRDREESLARARREASLADGISWGMDEDAIEETPEVNFFVCTIFLLNLFLLFSSALFF
jgi:hypothetical protein